MCISTKMNTPELPTTLCARLCYPRMGRHLSIDLASRHQEHLPTPICLQDTQSNIWIWTSQSCTEPEILCWSPCFSEITCLQTPPLPTEPESQKTINLIGACKRLFTERNDCGDSCYNFDGIHLWKLSYKALQRAHVGRSATKGNRILCWTSHFSATKKSIHRKRYVSRSPRLVLLSYGICDCVRDRFVELQGHGGLQFVRSISIELVLPYQRLF